MPLSHGAQLPLVELNRVSEDMLNILHYRPTKHPLFPATAWILPF